VKIPDTFAFLGRTRGEGSASAAAGLRWGAPSRGVVVRGIPLRVGKLYCLGVAVVVVVGLTASLSTAAARGDPACVDVTVTREQASSIDPLGTPFCEPTPWKTLVTVQDGHSQTGLPPNTPNGYVVTVIAPAPEP
jgi:hypothetical protein